MRFRFQLATALILTIGSYGLPAGADLTASERALAEGLFKEGRAFLDKGDFKDACPRFEASFKIDPADGTVLNLALCYEGLGRTATAWGYWNETLSRAKKAKRDDREKMAVEHIAKLEPQLPKVIIHVDPSVKLPGLVIKLDDDPIDEGAWETPVPVDPGLHVLHTVAPGFKANDTTFVMGANGEKRTLVVEPLEKLPPSPPPSALPTSNVPASKDATLEEKHRSPLAYVALGAGLVFIGGFVVARVAMGSALDARKSDCAAEHLATCTDVGISKVHTWQTVSWISGGLAVASLGVGLVLYASPTSNSAKTGTTLTISPTATGFRLEGVF